jgi:hypothetical protein
MRLCTAVRDDRMELFSALEIEGVPAKIYLEDGIVKQSCGGASSDDRERPEFTRWLQVTAASAR